MAVRSKLKSCVKGAIKGVARSEGGDFFFLGRRSWFGFWKVFERIFFFRGFEESFGRRF